MATGSRVERKKYQSKVKNYKGKGPKRKRSIFKRLLIILMALFFLAILGGAGLFAYYAMNAPTVTFEDLNGQVSSKIYDQNGLLIKELGAQNRDLMSTGEIPKVLEEAVLAIEDARFYTHHGIDPIRILGAFVSNLRAGELREGGSTITQQLIKLSVFSTEISDQTLERKAQEAWLSLELEQIYSKEEILTLYLNKLFYSNNVYGAKTATRMFFNKELNDLSIAEAALLAGLPQAPSDYDPYVYPQAAKERRDLVLQVMHDKGLITSSEYQEAVNTSIESMLSTQNLNHTSEKDFVIDAFLDVVAREVQEKANINIFTDGVEVYTTLNMEAQKHLYETLNNNVTVVFPDNNMQTAVSIIDVNSGALQALSGGRKQNVILGLNRANTLNRSIGSTMKPLSAYGPAIEYLNYSTGQLVKDVPMTYSNGADIQNFDFDFKGDMTLREALSGSRNITALKVLQNVGLDNAYAFLQKMDITILNDNARELVEANAIGGEVTPIQLSAAYATIANYGKYHRPYAVTKIITGSGSEVVFETYSTQAMKDSTAYMLTDILKGVPGNFAPSAQIDNLHHAGKTGTTNYTSDQIQQLGLDSNTYAAPDAWFVGFSPQYAIATWVGYDNPYEPGNYLTLDETRLPQKIYHEMMTYLSRNIPNTDWTMPQSVKQIEIEKYTDPIMLPGPYTPLDRRSTELFVASATLPTATSLAYGRYIAPPSAFDVQYNQETFELEFTWDGPLDNESNFELSVDGQVVYLGRDKTFKFKIPNESKEYALSLRIVAGVSFSDTSIINLSITDPETTIETTLLEETTLDPGNEPDSEQTTTPPPAANG